MEILVFTNKCASHVYIVLRNVENDGRRFEHILLTKKKYLFEIFK